MFDYKPKIATLDNKIESEIGWLSTEFEPFVQNPAYSGANAQRSENTERQKQFCFLAFANCAHSSFGKMAPRRV